MSEFDTDWLIVGSGFGGSVSALRLTEKGYDVSILESGRRFEDEDFAEKASKVRRYYFFPMLGMKGIFRITLFRDVFIGTGAGVGGGSLGYANTLYRSRPEFATHPQWATLGDWDAELSPHYDTAEKMLGVTTNDVDAAADILLHEYAEQIGVGDTYHRTRVGVFLGQPGKTVPDPYFAGAGPERTGCVRCGSCLLGCRNNAKNTLMKNYLWFAEKRGATIEPERTVTDIVPRKGTDGIDGYRVTHVRTGAWFRKDRKTIDTRGVVISAGPLGSNRLLQRTKLAGSLPLVSDRLGYLVRTNSESIVAVTAPDDERDFSAAIALTSSIHPSPDTHIEPVTYGRNADTQSLIFTLATEAGRRGTRPIYFLLNAIRHPRKFLRSTRVRRWSRRTVILAVMQTLDNSIRIKVRWRLPGGFPVLTTEQDPNHPNQDSVPAAYAAANWLAERIGGTVQAAATEAIFSIPTTAHLLGGAVIGESAAAGVINAKHEVFGYQNLLVCDGSAIPANVGVNPSLTITAMTERAMSFIPAKADGIVAPTIQFTTSSL
ncbi:cholesterol oxidase [Mycobacterium sp. MAA66]|uniref:GMC oxidoreductase n=1 Tax=Mycobacterium sp. MAA66 TaxID=3156297 RepID=UPI00351299BB